MNPAKIVVHVMERYCVLQVLKLFAECVGQARESAHRHSHREILALNEACRNVRVIGLPFDDRFSCAHANSRTVSGFWRVFNLAVNLVKHRIVDVRSESILDRYKVRAIPFPSSEHLLKSFSASC